MFVSIVVLCCDDRVNALEKRLREILQRVTFSYELIYVFRSRSIYLEKRPTDHAKFVCVQNFFGTRKQTKKVFQEITGDYVVVLSPNIEKSPFYMLDSLELIQTKDYDVVTIVGDVLPYSVVQKCFLKVKKILFPTNVFYVCKKEVLALKVEQKDMTHCSIYYLPYELENKSANENG